MREPFERLRDIQDAIVKIMRYTNQGRHTFDQDELVQTWVIHHLEIIGEAARAIPQSFKDLHSEIPWREYSGMRNILAHVYFGINQDRVWSIVEHDLPSLKTKIDAILNTEETR